MPCGPFLPASKECSHPCRSSSLVVFVFLCPPRQPARQTVGHQSIQESSTSPIRSRSFFAGATAKRLWHQRLHSIPEGHTGSRRQTDIMCCPGRCFLRMRNCQPPAARTSASRTGAWAHNFVCSLLVQESTTGSSPHLGFAPPKPGRKELTTIADKWPDCASSAEMLRLLVSPPTT